MSVIAAELANLPGVIAAGEQFYRGDRYSFKGGISDDMARMAAIMCRATTMSEHMQVGMLHHHCPDLWGQPPWSAGSSAGRPSPSATWRRMFFASFRTTRRR